MRSKFGALTTAVAVIAASSIATTAFAQSRPISTQYLTGTWKEDQRCRSNESIIFFPNQTMSSAGSIASNYVVSGPDEITLHGPGGAAPVRIEYVNQNQAIIRMQGRATVVHRCSANFAPPPAPYNPPAQYNPPAPYNPGPSLTNAYFVGSWGENGNCTAPDVFVAGGQLAAGNGHHGTWALFGQTLRLTLNNGGTVDFDVQPNGHRNMALTRQGFAPVNYTRC